MAPPPSLPKRFLAPPELPHFFAHIRTIKILALAPALVVHPQAHPGFRTPPISSLATSGYSVILDHIFTTGNSSALPGVILSKGKTPTATSTSHVAALSMAEPRARSMHRRRSAGERLPLPSVIFGAKARGKKRVRKIRMNQIFYPSSAR